MGTHRSSVRQEPRVGAETEVGETGRAKEARLPLPPGGGPGQVDLCFLLTSASSSPQPSPLGTGASRATFDQRLAYPLDTAFSPHRWV